VAVVVCVGWAGSASVAVGNITVGVSAFGVNDAGITATVAVALGVGAN
jgi:hypothetical protein